MISDWIRRTEFWILDACRGGVVWKNYKEIRYGMEHGVLNEQQLKLLMEHAVTNVPFYAAQDSNEFNSFPIINKNNLKQSWDQFHAVSYLGKPIHYMATSGSTGTPFVMEWDMGKRKRQLAELIYFNKIGGQELGQKYVYFRVWTEKNRKSKKELWMQNLLPIDILHLDNSNLEQIRNRLKKRPYINSCLAYASTYEYLTQYVQACQDTANMFHVKTFFSGSEVLSLEMKHRIKDTFGCNVIDRYSNEENGFLAQTEDVSDIFNVNTTGFKIEVLKQDSDEPVSLGEIGRIVVTDLYSFAVPLIRYDTGDLAIKYAEKDGWTTALKAIQGRQVDVIYDTAGSALTPHTWSVYMWKFDKLKQYQFIQEGAKEYILKVNGAKGNYSDDELIKHLKSVLGQDAHVSVEHVDGIPALASGKFKKTVCNYHPGK